jgi:hypothetical protein
VRFVFTPPHCLKWNATFAAMHWSRTAGVLDDGWIITRLRPASTRSDRKHTFNQYSAVGAATLAYDDSGNLTDEGR